MAITDSLYFVYNGIRSDVMGIYNVNPLDNSTTGFEDVFYADRTIKEVVIRHRKKPYYQEPVDTPLTLTLRFYFQDTYDSDSIRKVTRWLCQDNYQELYFSDNENRRFMAMYVGSSKLVHNGLKQGYVDMTMRCDSPYAYTPVYQDPYPHDFSTSGGGTIPINNIGDTSCYPEIWINKVGTNNGDVSIINTSNGGQDFRFTSQSQGTETLTLNGSLTNGQVIIIGEDTYTVSSSDTAATIATNINFNSTERVVAYGDTTNNTVTVTNETYNPARFFLKSRAVVNNVSDPLYKTLFTAVGQSNATLVAGSVFPTILDSTSGVGLNTFNPNTDSSAACWSIANLIKEYNRCGNMQILNEAISIANYLNSITQQVAVNGYVANLIPDTMQFHSIGSGNAPIGWYPNLSTVSIRTQLSAIWSFILVYQATNNTVYKGYATTLLNTVAYAYNHIKSRTDIPSWMTGSLYDSLSDQLTKTTISNVSYENLAFSTNVFNHTNIDMFAKALNLYVQVAGNSLLTDISGKSFLPQSMINDFSNFISTAYNAHGLAMTNGCLYSYYYYNSAVGAQNGVYTPVAVNYDSANNAYSPNALWSSEAQMRMILGMVLLGNGLTNSYNLTTYATNVRNTFRKMNSTNVGVNAVGDDILFNDYYDINANPATQATAMTPPILAQTAPLSGTYRAKYTWITANGETLPSTTEASITISGNNVFQVKITATSPTGVIGANIYITQSGGAAGTETLQGTVMGVASSSTPLVYTQSLPPTTTGVALPTVNTTLNPTIADPTTGVALYSVAPTLGIGTYYVKYTWINASNQESLPSPESIITISSTSGVFSVQMPTFPVGATGANVYISTATGTETKQGTTSTTMYYQTTAISTTTASPPISSTMPLVSTALPIAPTGYLLALDKLLLITTDHDNTVATLNKFQIVSNDLNFDAGYTYDTLATTLVVDTKSTGKVLYALADEPLSYYPTAIALSTNCNGTWSNDYVSYTDGLNNGEQVYIDCENQRIISSLANTYRFDSFNDNYLELVEGMNYLTVKGNCAIQFRYRFNLMQG